MSQPPPYGQPDPYGAAPAADPTRIGQPTSAYGHPEAPYDTPYQGDPYQGDPYQGGPYQGGPYAGAPGYPPGQQYGQPPYPPAGGWPDPGPPRKRWPMIVAVVAAVAIVGGGVAIGVTMLTDDPASRPVAPVVPAPTTTPPVPTPSASPPTGATTFPLPPAAPGGDPVADEQLWNSLSGTGVMWDTCSFSEPVVPQAASQLDCRTANPQLGNTVSFELYPGDAELAAELGRIDGQLTGEPATDCGTGGKHRGAFLSWELVCGFATQPDGSSQYIVTWRHQDKLVLGTLADPDPGTVWDWWLAHTPF